MEAGQSPIDRRSTRESGDPDKIIAVNHGSNKISVVEIDRNSHVSNESYHIWRVYHFVVHNYRVIIKNHLVMLGLKSLYTPSNSLGGNKTKAKYDPAQLLPQHFISIY